MADGSPGHHVRRKRLIADKPVQLAMALTVAGMTAAGLVVLLASMFVLPVDAYFDRVSGADMRRSLLIILSVFFGLTVLGITLSCVVLSHRFVGPAQVVRKALLGMARDDFDERLELRGTDYLEDLAAAAVALRDVLVKRHGDLADVQRLLDAGEVDDARRLLASALRADAPERVLAGVRA